MEVPMKKRIFLTLLTSLMIFLFIVPAFGRDGRDKKKHGKAKSGAVFIMTNSAKGNLILMYRRSGKGRLSYQDYFPTGGLGSGAGKTVEIDPLGSQNSLSMSEDGLYLFAVNAGDDTITAFQVTERYLKFLDQVWSGGRFPVSLTFHKDTLYVLNAGAMDADGNGTPANITGFRLAGHRFVPLDESTRELVDVPQNPTDFDSDFPNILVTPAQIQFSPDGELLVVTVKDAVNAVNNAIWIFDVDKENEYLTGEIPLVFETEGPAPFGFIFDSVGRLIVTDAGASTVTSYEVGSDSVEMIDAVETGQAATCWIAGTRPFFQYVYAANTGSGTLSGYRVKKDGTLSEVGRFPVNDGALNIDTAITRDGKYLYTQNGGLGTVSIFRVNRNGKLHKIDEVEVTEPFSGFQGIVAW